MTINSWVRLRAVDGSRGQVIAISRDCRHVWVRWPSGVRMHAPEDLELIEEKNRV